MPLIDELFKLNNLSDSGKINIMDVGGGSGAILLEISNYINRKYNLSVDKFALDLDPNLLERQKKRCLNLKKALNENICKTSLGDKEIDIILMIDVLEHIPDAEKALNEIRRISRFVILKVPLQDNITANFYNRITRGKYRKSSVEGSGHVNFYNYRSITRLIKDTLNSDCIVDYRFTNVFDYYLNSSYYCDKFNILVQIYYYIGHLLYMISPKLCSYIFTDYILILIKCN